MSDERTLPSTGEPSGPSASQVDNPFIGTQAFRTGDKLFGRDGEIVDFTNRLMARRVVVLHSPSGAGKTSLVQAGLIPVLNKKGIHILPKIRLNSLPPEDRLPPGQPFNRYLFSALMSLDAGQGILEDQRLPYLKMVALSLKASGLSEYLEIHAPYAEKTVPKRGPAKKASLARSLLFFDQFEEVLTLDPIDAGQKKDFFARLTPVLNDYRYLVIFAMREEFFAGLEPYLIYFPERLSTRFRLELLGQPAAMEAIRKPAQRVKVSFQKKAVESLVQELCQITVREGGQEKKIPGPFVEPVQLQVVCRDLFERRANPGQITMEDVHALGPVENALGAYYDKKIKHIAGGDEALERRLRDWIETELIIGGSLRGQAAAGEEAKAGLDRAAVEKLIESFLVREEPRRGVVWYELAHDSLVRPVVACNATWRELHASEFELQAARWAKAPEIERERLFPLVEALRRAVVWGEERLGRLSETQLQYLNAARKELQRLETRQDDRAVLGLNLEDTGWGVIFASDAPAELREALTELLDYRREQASRKRVTYYREFFGANGYRPGETAQRFLARFDAGSGPANPEKIPYYLLIVGEPEAIPFEFQYGLDAQYAVGRIAFATLEEYARYARSVVLSETEHAAGRFDLPNRLAVFATQNEGDRATAFAMDYLIRPVLAELTTQAPNWKIDPLLSGQATKANLAQLLGGAQAPALLFTSTHGASWPKDHPDQILNQGALVCQDWSRSSRKLQPDFYFSANDVNDHMSLLGTILFAYGAWTAGTPEEDNFSSSQEVKPIAPRSFLARLPQKLLGYPLGGALAVIGHVERAWGYSFLSEEFSHEGQKGETDQENDPGGSRENVISDTGTFVKTLSRLMQGVTVGLAMEDFNRRYSYFSSLLSEELIAVTFYNKPREDFKLMNMRNQTIDARNFILIGDPAVRLPVRPDLPYQEPPPGWSRPQIGPVRLPVVAEQESATAAPPPPPPESQPGVEIPAVQKSPAADPLAQANLESIAQALLKGQKINIFKGNLDTSQSHDSDVSGQPPAGTKSEF